MPTLTQPIIEKSEQQDLIYEPPQLIIFEAQELTEGTIDAPSTDNFQTAS